MAEYTADEFARALLKSVTETPKATVRAVRRNATEVKKTAQRNVRETAPVQNAHAFRAINFDVEAVGVEVIADIGYDKTINGGPLGNLLEFGGGGDHSPPHRDLGRAVDGQEALFMDDLGRMGEEVMPP